MRLNIKQGVTGILSGILLWVIFIACDAIEENTTHTYYIIGDALALVVPIALFTWYTKFLVNGKLHVEDTVIWLTSFYLSFIASWFVAFNFSFIKQHVTSNFIDFNGIEYVLFGFSVLMVFSVLCLIFHVVYEVLPNINRVKN